MRTLSFSMGVSLDGFITDRRGEIDWSVPDPELFAFHLEEVRAIDLHLCGRRLYETMTYWETFDMAAGGPEAEFAAVWQTLPKVVFSTTLDSVVGTTRIATGSVVEEVERLKAEPGKEIAVGGAALAATCARHGLIDEFKLFVHPVVLGGGTPYFPPLDHRLDLELAGTRTFPGGVVLLHHRVRKPS